MVLQCFRLILIVGPRPILGYLMISYGFHQCCYSFAMFPVDLNRRPSPDLRSSYDFQWFPMVFYVFAMFPIDFNRRPSPDLRLSCVFVLFSYGFAMFLICFWLILIVGPHPIFGYLMISYGFVWFSYGFAMFPIDFNRRPSPDLRLSYDFLWFCIVFLWFCYVSN